MDTVVDELRQLLASYTEPCVGDCDHSQCPLLRELHALAISNVLEQARQTVKPVVDVERKGEEIGDLMDMRLRAPSPVAATVDVETVDARLDRAYVAGAKFGWNCAEEGAAGLDRLQAAIRGRYADIQAAHNSTSPPSDSSIQARHYFCSCGGALTAEEYIEHYFEKGHDHGDLSVAIRAAAAEIASYLFANVFHPMGVGGISESQESEIAAILSKHLGSAAVGEQEGKEQG